MTYDNWLSKQASNKPKEFKFYADVDATIIDTINGKEFKVFIKDIDLTDRYGYFEDASEALRYFSTNVEDVVFEYIDKDSRFDSYNTFENLNCRVDNISIEEKLEESVSYKRSKVAIMEANESLTTKVSDFVADELDELESSIPDKLYKKIDGYDPNWCSDIFDNAYQQAKNNYQAELKRILFANFNK